MVRDGKRWPLPHGYELTSFPVLDSIHKLAIATCSSCAAVRLAQVPFVGSARNPCALLQSLCSYRGYKLLLLCSIGAIRGPCHIAVNLPLLIALFFAILSLADFPKKFQKVLAQLLEHEQPNELNRLTYCRVKQTTTMQSVDWHVPRPVWAPRPPIKHQFDSSAQFQLLSSISRYD